MATFTKLPSGSWRVQVRRKGRDVGETFLRRDAARLWAIDAELQIDRGETPSDLRISRLKTFGELIDLHIDDLCGVGKPPLRSKAATLDTLKRQLGKCNMTALDRERVIRFGPRVCDTATNQFFCHTLGCGARLLGSALQFQPRNR